MESWQLYNALLLLLEFPQSYISQHDSLLKHSFFVLVAEVVRFEGVQVKRSREEESW